MYGVFMLDFNLMVWCEVVEGRVVMLDECNLCCLFSYSVLLYVVRGVVCFFDEDGL